MNKRYDSELDEEIVICSQCGCEENIEEIIDGMCPDCYEDYLEDIEDSEED